MICFGGELTSVTGTDKGVYCPTLLVKHISIERKDLLMMKTLLLAEADLLLNLKLL
jgi:hypothetical protein